MRLYLTALNPTDAVLDGFLPAAARLGLPVTVLTDRPDRWPAAVGAPDHPGGGTVHRPAADVPPVETVGCDVRDPAAVVAAVRAGRPAAGLLSNSDHLQTATALAAERLGLPGKDWRVTRRCKDKLLTRRTLASAGCDTVATRHLGPADDPHEVAAGLPFPAVVKPREGVASEDVRLVTDPADLADRVAGIRRRRPGASLVVEEYLDGELRTFETLGDGTALTALGGWRTTLGPPPAFVEESLDWSPTLPDPVRDDLRRQLAALGIGIGACHTEFVAQGDRARLIEVNYRLIGDRMDLILAELLDVPLFAHVIRLHLGEPLAALPLPDPAGVDRHARVEYVCADAAGTLVAAPGPVDRAAGDVRLGCRPLRGIGVTAPLTGTNRDYLAVLHGIGPDPASVRRALTEFRAGHRWEIAT